MTWRCALKSLADGLLQVGLDDQDDEHIRAAAIPVTAGGGLEGEKAQNTNRSTGLTP